MSDFFIGWFESLVPVFVWLMIIGVLASSAYAVYTPGGGLFAGFAVFLFGSLGTVVIGGTLFLVFGIYNNTRRMAEATEKMAAE